MSWPDRYKEGRKPFAMKNILWNIYIYIHITLPIAFQICLQACTTIVFVEEV
jgi:hypothetical protein